MGNNRFRLSHVMPNAWFYKLRDMGMVGRAAGLSNPSSTQMMRQRPAAPTRKSRSPESAIRRSFELAQTHRGGPFMYPSLHRPSALDSGLSDDKRTDEGDLYQSHQQVAQPRKHRASSAAAGSARKNSNSTPAVVGSSISAGCSCRTTVSSSSRKSRDSSSDDHHLHHVEEEQEQFIRKSRVKMQMPSKHVLQYGFNNVAGLPSPVHGDEEEEEQEEQAVAAVFKVEEDEFVEVTETVKEMPCNCKACVDAGPGPRLCLPSSSSSRSYASYSPSETEVTAAVVAEVPKRRLKTRIGVSGSPKLRSVYQEKPNRKQKQYDKSTTRSRKSQQQQQRQSCSVSSGSQKPSSNPRGFAVVKRSYDPEKDFRESMVEMILHNQLSSYKDLLKLLECYLSLNSQEYHHTIVEVFQQVWLDLIPFPKT